MAAIPWFRNLTCHCPQLPLASGIRQSGRRKAKQPLGQMDSINRIHAIRCNSRHRRMPQHDPRIPTFALANVPEALIRPWFGAILFVAVQARSVKGSPVSGRRPIEYVHRHVRWGCSKDHLWPHCLPSLITLRCWPRYRDSSRHRNCARVLPSH